MINLKTIKTLGLDVHRRESLERGCSKLIMRRTRREPAQASIKSARTRGLDLVGRGVLALRAFVDALTRIASQRGQRAEKMHGPIAQIAFAQRTLMAGMKVHTPAI